MFDRPSKTIFQYDDIRAEPHAVLAKNINPYLVDAADLFLIKKREPIQRSTPPMAFGSMPNDGGNLILTEDQAAEVTHRCPALRAYVRRLMGSEELINGGKRYALWLQGAAPHNVRACPDVRPSCALEGVAGRSIRPADDAAEPRQGAPDTRRRC